MKRGKRYDTSDVMFSIITDAKKRCKHCGHTLLLGYSEKKICYVCGNYVYRNNKIEFREQIKYLQKKVKELEEERKPLIDLKNKYLSDLRCKNLEIGRLKKKLEE